MDRKKADAKVYLVGGGIASLAAAVYLIQDAGVKGENITVFNDSGNLGGSLDAQYSREKDGYIMRGIRMFEEKSFNCTFDLMSRIPSLDFPDKSLRDVFAEYNSRNKTYSKSRLVSGGRVLEQHRLKLRARDRLALARLVLRREKSLEYLRIEDYFGRPFFRSNFWLEFSTVFAFEPWHSLMEFRRYFIRFIQDFPAIDTLEGIEITPYNQYESMILPIAAWLEKQGVGLENNKKVLDADFKEKDGQSFLDKLYCQADGELIKIPVGRSNFVFTTLGSIVANTSVGSMDQAPRPVNAKSTAWSLWENIAEKRDNFGNPKVFNSRIDRSKWVSFTITCKDKTFPRLLNRFIDEKVSSFGGVNLVSSNWLMSLVLNYKPYFKDQAPGTYVCWGYGLYPDKAGNFIKKKMVDCGGEEIMREALYHLDPEEGPNRIIRSLACIPCLSPYVTSQFLPRAISDRPQIIPKGALNYACLGQYCESPRDVVFTVDYSIRTAQKAVYALFNTGKTAVPIYNGFYHAAVLPKALATLLR